MYFTHPIRPDAVSTRFLASQQHHEGDLMRLLFNKSDKWHCGRHTPICNKTLVSIF